MRDNFRPNVRLTTNILMVFGIFLIAFNLVSIGKQDKEFIQRRDDCAEAGGEKISLDDFIKKYNLASREGFVFEWVWSKSKTVDDFCQFYKNGTLNP